MTIFRGISGSQYIYWDDSLVSTPPFVTNITQMSEATITVVSSSSSITFSNQFPTVDGNTRVFYSFNGNVQDSGSLGAHLTLGTPLYSQMFGGENSRKISRHDGQTPQVLAISATLDPTTGSFTWETAIFINTLPTVGGIWIAPFGHGSFLNSHFFIRADSLPIRQSWYFRDSTGTSQNVTASVGITAQKWVSCFFVVDVKTSPASVTGSVYQDGVKVGERIFSGVSSSTTSSVFFVGGNHTTTDMFQGRIAFIKLHTKALSAAEVLTAYSSSVNTWGI